MRIEEDQCNATIDQDHLEREGGHHARLFARRNVGADAIEHAGYRQDVRIVDATEAHAPRLDGGLPLMIRRTHQGRVQHGRPDEDIDLSLRRTENLVEEEFSGVAAGDQLDDLLLLALASHHGKFLQVLDGPLRALHRLLHLQRERLHRDIRRCGDIARWTLRRMRRQSLRLDSIQQPLHLAQRQPEFMGHLIRGGRPSGQQAAVHAFLFRADTEHLEGSARSGSDVRIGHRFSQAPVRLGPTLHLPKSFARNNTLRACGPSRASAVDRHR